MSTRARLKSLEHQARSAIVLKTLWLARQARPGKQVDILRQRLETMDAATRREVYEALTDSELESLAGDGAQAYLASLPDSQIELIATDRSGKAAEQEHKRFRQWRKGR